MATPFLKLWRHRRHRVSLHRSKTLGFTLTELLVSIIIGGLIVSGLLYLVVELLQTDARESARNETQREMQMSVDYIASDLREAVYVYDDPSTLKPYLPDFGADIPVLAFWKPRPIASSEMPANCDGFTGTVKIECETLRIRRHAYSLVVYLQSTQNTTGTWSGQSRILRYELPKYTNVATLTRSKGYVEPTLSETSFRSWPLNATGTNLQGTGNRPDRGAPPVLVDFVDAPGNTQGGTAPTCDTGYKRSPATTATPTSSSFFSCIREISTGADPNLNQDVLVYLRGNVNGRGGGLGNVYFPVQTQVLVRGIIDKVPPS
jgi:prepilin-type N-terminal cleavage/methylation domain-containing protein